MKRSSRWRSQILGATSGLSLLLNSPATLAEPEVERQDGEHPRGKENKAEAPARPQDMPLAILPSLPSLEALPPRPLALEAIDRLLAQVVSHEALERDRAQRTLLEAKSDWVSGITRRIDSLAESADRVALKKLLSSLRDKTRERIKREEGSKGQTPDYLSISLEHPDPQSKDWRDLSQLLALNRMLAAIGNAEATRQIIYIYVRFGEFMRIDCQRQLESLGDLAVAALIETRRHPATHIATWATKRLRLLKKLTAHQAVRTTDDQALRDILIALGRSRDPDSTKLLISFAGTERAQIRLAARQGLVLLGDVASWQLKDAYLNTTGKHPPRDWTWKRSARELFTEFDRLRLSRVYKLYATANAAKEAGNFKAMADGYDQVLALDPLFDSRDEMVAGYKIYADSVKDSNQRAAILALRRAERIALDPASKKESKAQRRLLEADELRTRGIIDRGIIEQAVALDPRNAEKAQELLQSSPSPVPWGARSRYLVAAAVSAVALLGAVWILLSGWRRSHKKSPTLR